VTFQKRSGGDFAPIHNLVEDGPLVGTYVTTRDADFGFGPKPVHTFAVAGGAETAVFGNFRINELVETIKDEKPQPIVRLTYLGKKRTSNGNSVNDILVELSYDEEDAEALTAAPYPELSGDDDI
jgi:hypothetical protein